MDEARAPLISEPVVVQNDESLPPFSWRKFLRFAGPGLLMCIAYIDPGNLESDLQTGATTGYALLWLLAVTMCMGYVVQMQAAKLGVATGRHLAELCRAQYPRPASLMLWIMAEVAIIGSDVQEVIGCAIALKLLSGGAIPLWAGSIIAAAASFLLLLTENVGVRYLEAIFAVMIAAMVAAFGFMFAHAHVPTAEVARGFLVPHLPRRDIPTAVALFGSLIMPHNIYLHSALVQTRGLAGASPAVKADALRYFKLESALSLIVVCFINLWVVAVFAAGFYDPTSDPPDIGLQNAGEFLGRTYGSAVVAVWGLGLLAAGQSSTMTGTYTGQFVMSGFLNLRVSPWARILVTRAVALVPTLAVALLMDPASTQLDKLNQALNLLQSVQLPFALIPVLTFTGSTRIMGKRLANGWGTTVLCWGIAVVVIGVNMAAVAEVAGAWAEATAELPVMRTALTATLVALVAAYCLFILYLLACGPRSRLASAARSLLRAASECPHTTDSEEEVEEAGGLGAGAGLGAPGGRTGGAAGLGVAPGVPAGEEMRMPLLIKEVVHLEQRASSDLGPLSVSLSPPNGRLGLGLASSPPDAGRRGPPIRRPSGGVTAAGHGVQGPASGHAQPSVQPLVLPAAGAHAGMQAHAHQQPTHDSAQGGPQPPAARAAGSETDRILAHVRPAAARSPFSNEPEPAPQPQQGSGHGQTGHDDQTL